MNGLPWKLWLSQVLAIIRLEMRKSFSVRRSIPVYLLAVAPVILFGGHSVAYSWGITRCSAGEDLAVFSAVFQVFTLRLAIFFGCVVIFMNLFRGEVLQKSLHFYFLSPVRRQVLVIGKYLSGMVTAIMVFSLGTLFSYLIVCAHVAAVRHQDLFAGPALAHLASYIGATALACVGYGAVFLMMGLLFRNPMIPAVAVLVWESIVVFLPPLLKKFSVIFYLESLCPVFPGGLKGIFAITAEPVSVWIAVAGLLCLTAVVLTLAGLRIRSMEINYGTE